MKLTERIHSPTVVSTYYGWGSSGALIKGQKAQHSSWVLSMCDHPSHVPGGCQSSLPSLSPPSGSVLW